MIGSFRNGFALAGAALLLSGCGTFPLPKVYVLGEPAPATAGVSSDAGLPHLELKTVRVPDYLDTTDIVRRRASNEVIASSTGSWGERVSIGITHALAIDLTRRLPNVVIDSGGAFQPARRLLVDIERFEISETGGCTLTARWRITTADNRVASDSEQGTFILPATSVTDAAITQTMTAAIDQLAGRIAVTVEAQSP